MLQSPYISVVIPTFNRCESLKVTLNALKNQTLDRDQFEVVVIDDGSTDGTPGLLERFSSSARYTLRSFRQDNAGPGQARNRGAEEARGEIILYIDDDIEPCSRLLEVHSSHHRENGNVVVVGPMSPDRALDRTEPMWIIWEHAMLQKIYLNLINKVWPSLGPNHFYSGNASLRREQLLAIGGFDVSFKRQEDVEMAYRLIRKFKSTFIFSTAADGIHRPSRTFESWYKVPYSYGQYDVIRYRRGDISYETLVQAFDRHPLTNIIAREAISHPRLMAPTRTILVSCAHIAWGLGLRQLAMSILSALYNLRYMEGAAVEIGEPDEIIKMMPARRSSSSSG